MIGVLAISAWLYLLSAAFITMGWVMTCRLAPEHRRRQIIRWLITWSGQGLVLPFVVWCIMNVGLSWNLQPYMPAIQAAKNAGLPWFPQWVRVTAAGLFIISSYWSAATLTWVLVGTSKGISGEQLKDLRGLTFTCCCGLGIPALIILLLGSWPMAGFAACVILAPLAGYAPTIVQPSKTPPMYARAVARIKFGKYQEAEWEIIRELEKSEDDFEGWLMLAELYATRFGDIAEAEATILEICDQPKLTPSQLSIALHKLADWQLKVGSDPAAAKRALQMIAERLKGSHLARMALLRANQLPDNPEQLREQQTPKAVPLPMGGDELDRSSDGLHPPLDKQTAARLANTLVEQLTKDPNDVTAREKLARMFAEDLGRTELALEQLSLLLDMPDQPEGLRAHWLGLMAAWQIKLAHNPEEGRRLLEKLIHDFPTTPQAFAARRRLVLLSSEARSHQRA